MKKISTVPNYRCNNVFKGIRYFEEKLGKRLYCDKIVTEYVDDECVATITVCRGDTQQTEQLKINVEKMNLYGDFQEDGIEVYVEAGHLIIVDAQEREEFPDTPENREKLITEAKRIKAEWEEGR